MKSYLFKINLSLLLILVASFSFGQKADPITFEKRTQKFGKVNEGKVIELVYRYHNYGKHVLSINPPKVDCSCTEVIIPDKIRSGGKDSLTIKFNTKDKIGFQERTVVLQFVNALNPSTPIEKKITFKGTIIASKETKRIYKENKKKK